MRQFHLHRGFGPNRHSQIRFSYQDAIPLIDPSRVIDLLSAPGSAIRIAYSSFLLTTHTRIIQAPRHRSPSHLRQKNMETEPTVTALSPRIRIRGFDPLHLGLRSAHFTCSLEDLVISSIVQLRKARSQHILLHTHFEDPVPNASHIA